MFLLYWLLECYTLQMSFQISPLKASHSTFSRPFIRLCLILLWDRCSSYRPRSLTTPSSVYTLLILCIRMVIHSSCVKHPLSILQIGQYSKFQLSRKDALCFYIIMFLFIIATLFLAFAIRLISDEAEAADIAFSLDTVNYYEL